MNEPGLYDFDHFWVVIEYEGEGQQSRLHTFDNFLEASSFAQEEAPRRRSGPLAMARTTLEQAAPLLYVAGASGVRGEFLNLARRLAELDGTIDFAYLGVRHKLLQGSSFVSDQLRSLAKELHPHLLRHKTARPKE